MNHEPLRHERSSDLTFAFILFIVCIAFSIMTQTEQIVALAGVN